MKSPTELEKLQAYIDEQKKNGLVSFNFFVSDADKSGATVESIAKEVNELLNGKEVPITDIL